jgi:hypothetical protein
MAFEIKRFGDYIKMMKPLKINTFGDDLTPPVLKPIETPAQKLAKAAGDKAAQAGDRTPSYDDMVKDICGTGTSVPVTGRFKRPDYVRITHIDQDDQDLRRECSFEFKEPKTDYHSKRVFSIYFHKKYKKFFYDAHTKGHPRASSIWGPYDTMSDAYMDVSTLYDFKANKIRRCE